MKANDLRRARSRARRAEDAARGCRPPPRRAASCAGRRRRSRRARSASSSRPGTGETSEENDEKRTTNDKKKTRFDTQISRLALPALALLLAGLLQVFGASAICSCAAAHKFHMGACAAWHKVGKVFALAAAGSPV
eukprot:scaffold203846_cov22-Tisochrysis_lutea.AAC.1